jgi:hypothetical protein
MSPEDLRAKIHAAAKKFIDDVTAEFADAFARVAADLVPVSKPRLAARPAVARHRAPAAKRAISAPRGVKGPRKRVRRSGEQLAEAGDSVITLLAANKRGLRAEEIKTALGMSTHELMRPIQKLFTEGKIKKFGERRATTYFVA